MPIKTVLVIQAPVQEIAFFKKPSKQPSKASIKN